MSKANAIWQNGALTRFCQYVGDSFSGLYFADFDTPNRRMIAARTHGQDSAATDNGALAGVVRLMPKIYVSRTAYQGVWAYHAFNRLDVMYSHAGLTGSLVPSYRFFPIGVDLNREDWTLKQKVVVANQFRNESSWKWVPVETVSHLFAHGTGSIFEYKVTPNHIIATDFPGYLRERYAYGLPPAGTKPGVKSGTRLFAVSGFPESFTADWIAQHTPCLPEPVTVTVEKPETPYEYIYNNTYASPSILTYDQQIMEQLKKAFAQSTNEETLWNVTVDSAEPSGTGGNLFDMP